MPSPLPKATPSTHYNTTYENGVWIPEIIANESLGRLDAYMNLGKTVARDSDLTTSKEGDTINVPIRGTLVSHEKQEDTDITLQQPKGTSVPVVLDHHREISFGEEDFVASIQHGSPVPEYINDAVAILAEDIETALLGKISGFEHIGPNDASYLDRVGKVRQRLVEKRVPKLSQKFAYVAPKVITNLLKENAFKDPKLYENQHGLVDGTIGRVHDIDFFEGQLVAGSGSPSEYQNFVYSRNALVLVTRPLRQIDGQLGAQSAVVQSEAGVSVRVIRTWNPMKLAIQITVDVLYGANVLDERLGLVWETE